MVNRSFSKVVDEHGHGMRLDHYLCAQPEFVDVSRSTVQKLIESSQVLVNKISPKSKTILKFGDEVRVEYHASEPLKLNPRQIDLDILFEDDALIVVNKPAGLVVHPGAGTQEATLVEGLLHHTRGQLSNIDGAEERPGIVHRLDKDTSGVLVVAKNNIAHAFLAKQFADKTSYREYWALLDGLLSKKVMVRESYLLRDGQHRTRFRSKELSEVKDEDKTTGKYAKSTFTVQKVYGHRLSLVKVVLATGRTHQIRVHACDLKAPVVGDLTYHRKVQLPSVFPREMKEYCQNIKRQMLHAKILRFVHPTTKKDLSFETNLPNDFNELLERLAPYESLSY